jgi:hypothetical protein
VSPRSRAFAADIAVAAAFSASAATLFVLGDERDGSLAFFLAWLAAHVLYGIVSGSFWALFIVVACPPLFVATTSGNGDETPLWLQAAFVEAFYGVPFAFMGIVGRRLWRARRPPGLPRPSGRKESSE